MRAPHRVGLRTSLIVRRSMTQGASGVISDLDGVIEPRPTWRARWLAPLLLSAVLAAVLAASFGFWPKNARPGPASLPQAGVQASRQRDVPLSVAVPANVVERVPSRPRLVRLELPPELARFGSRVEFSGITGLTSIALTDGYRDLYRLDDGRTLTVFVLPEPSGALAVSAGWDVEALLVRGRPGLSYSTTSTGTPLVVAWSADGTMYQVGGAGFTVAELIRLAEALR